MFCKCCGFVLFTNHERSIGVCQYCLDATREYVENLMRERFGNENKV